MSENRHRKEVFFKLGFTTCKAEHPLSTKSLKHTGNIFRKILQLNRCLLILDLKLLTGERKAFYR